MPPKYQRQALEQLTRKQRTAENSKGREKQPGRMLAEKDFDSVAEYRYYCTIVYPAERAGMLRSWEMHRRFDLLPKKTYGGLTLPAAHYTPDFVLMWADGRVEVVEIKSKFTRRAQRDYIYRRRLFIDLVAEPQGWDFVEIVDGEEAGK